MRRLELTRADGDRVEAVARSRFGMHARFHGVRRPGWLWLQSRFVLIGLAAAPSLTTDGHTRVAFTGAYAFRAARPWSRSGCPARAAASWTGWPSAWASSRAYGPLPPPSASAGPDRSGGSRRFNG